MPESSPPTYTQTELQEILHLALVQQSAGAGELAFSPAQLLEIAEELHIDPATLRSAETEWRQQQGQSLERSEFDRDRRQRFLNNLVRYGIINGALVALNVFLLGGPQFLWSAYPLILWGASLAWRGWQLWQLSGEAYERRFQSWQNKRQLRQSFSKVLNRVLS